MRAPRRPTACALLLLLGLCLAAPAAARVVRLYEVRHRVAAELLPLAQGALGERGRVVADERTNSLLLTGEPVAVEEALALVARFDVRPRTVLLRYASEDAASLAARGVRVDWRIDSGGFRVGSLSGPGEGSGVAVRAGESLEQRDGSLTSSLRILEGESGRIASGVLAPLTSRRILRDAHGAFVQESTRLVPAEQGFEATPRVLGDGRIELTLRPFHDRVAPDGRIETAGAETRLLLSPGETLVLGSVGQAEQGDRRSLLAGAGSDAASGERLLLIRASLE